MLEYVPNLMWARTLPLPLSESPFSGTFAQADPDPKPKTLTLWFQGTRIRPASSKPAMNVRMTEIAPPSGWVSFRLASSAETVSRRGPIAASCYRLSLISINDNRRCGCALGRLRVGGYLGRQVRRERLVAQVGPRERARPVRYRTQVNGVPGDLELRDLRLDQGPADAHRLGAEHPAAAR